MAVYFVTGSSRGFGAEIVREALSRGHQVVATARSADRVRDRFPDAGDALLPVSLDVTDEDQVGAAVEQAKDRFGTVDVLVNNAGRGLLGAVEEADADAVRAVYETNVFGVLNVQRGILPVMRAQRSGRVINISSVGGFTSSEGWGVYCSTKFALEGISEAMAIELAPLGIKVTIVEPGYFRTDFLDGSSLSTVERVIEDYAETSGRMRDTARRVNHAQPGDPVKAAVAILDVAESDNPPLRIPLGTDSVAAMETKLGFVAKELAQWRALATSTNLTD
ncbi:oxidoreductase [Streptomyces sp. NPDC051217]|uniref:oxidoreductase n=1 Tax=Streptomyces sp. NPDC051217 TaxID=3365644 RepID=UPI0037A84393